MTVPWPERNLVAEWKTQIGAVVERLHQPRRGEGRVDQQRQAVFMGDRRDGRDVEHVQSRVAEGLAEEQPRLGADRRTPGVMVAGAHESRGDAEARQGVVQQVVGAAVERARADDVAAGAGQRADRQVQRGLTTGRGDRAHAAFERRHSLLEHRIGRIRDAAVDVSRALHVEQRRCVLAVLEDERGRQVDGYGARAGGRVGRGAGMQREGVEAGIGRAGHGVSGRLREAVDDAVGARAQEVLRRVIVGYIGSASIIGRRP